MLSIQVSKVTQLTGHNASVYTLTEDGNDRFILSGDGGGWIVRWDLEEPELGKLIAKADGNIYSLLSLPDQDLLIAGNMNGGVHWISLKENGATKDVQHHKKGVFDILKLNDEIITLGGAGMITKWSIEEQRTLESFHLTNQSLRSADFNEVRNEIAIAASDHNIYILDATSWSIKHVIRSAHENSVFTVKYSPDGAYLWSGGRDAHLKNWAIERDYEPLSSQPAHWFTINDIAFHPSGKIFATASRDKTIRIWEAETFKLLKTLDTVRDGNHINSVNALYWSSYNNYLISCSDDRSLIIWQIEVE